MHTLWALSTGHYCSCHSFFWDVVSRNEQFLCKHQLAARLADVLHLYATITVGDLLLGNLLIEYMAKPGVAGGCGDEIGGSGHNHQCW